MDLLSSGPDRGPVRPRTWPARPPLPAAVLMAVVLMAVLLGAAGAVVASRAHREPAAGLRVSASSVVAVQGDAREGVLQLDVANVGPTAVELARVELAVPGVQAAPALVERQLPAGARLGVDVPFQVSACPTGMPAGSLLVVLRSGTVVRLPVRPDGGLVAPAPTAVAPGPGGQQPLAVDLLGACGVPRPEVVAVSAVVVGGVRYPSGDGLRGWIRVEVSGRSGYAALISVRSELAGVLFFPASVGPLPAGRSVEVVLAFTVPSCAGVGAGGRVVVTLAGPYGVRRDLAFPGQAGHPAVNLDVIRDGCRDGVPVP